MSYLYIIRDKAKIACRENECVVEYDENERSLVPIETLEGIDIFGNAQLTTQAIHKFLLKGIPVSFYSKSGKFFGKLMSTGHINAKRQRQQSSLGLNKEQCLKFDKKIIKAKANNQLIVLQRYSRYNDENIEEERKNIKALINRVDLCQEINELMGYEGNIAKNYFKGLGKLIDKKFKFEKRSRRPPLDEFNSLISYGYTILLNEIYGKIEKHGLNPYFGFMHSDNENHPTLCSDLIEEWRAVIVDSLAMSLINGHEITKEQFERDFENGGIYLNKDANKLFLKKINDKLSTNQKYIEDYEYEVSYRRGIDLQVMNLVRAIEAEDLSLYNPIKIR